LQADLGRLRMFVSLWWSGKLVGALLPIGGRLVDLNAPPELLIQLSRLMLNMQSAGLINIEAAGDGSTRLSFVSAYPPWLPLPELLDGFCGAIVVFWYGLGR
jgi:hypothetical protein